MKQFLYLTLLMFLSIGAMAQSDPVPVPGSSTTLGARAVNLNDTLTRQLYLTYGANKSDRVPRYYELTKQLLNFIAKADSVTGYVTHSYFNLHIPPAYTAGNGIIKTGNVFSLGNATQTTDINFNRNGNSFRLTDSSDPTTVFAVGYNYSDEILAKTGSSTLHMHGGIADLTSYGYNLAQDSVSFNTLSTGPAAISIGNNMFGQYIQSLEFNVLSNTNNIKPSIKLNDPFNQKGIVNGADYSANIVTDDNALTTTKAVKQLIGTTGATNFIQNQSTAAQTGSNFWIDGMGKWGDSNMYSQIQPDALIASYTPTGTFSQIDATNWAVYRITDNAELFSISTSLTDTTRINGVLKPIQFQNKVYLNETPKEPKQLVRLKDLDTLKYGNKADFKYPNDMVFRPFKIYEKSGKYYPDKSNYDIIATKIKNMKPYFVDYENGSNANNGLSPTTPVKTANYAFVTLGARLIYLAPGIYKSDWFNNISNSAGDDLIIIGSGQGRTYLTSADVNTHTWTHLAGNMYSTPVANADRAVDNNYTGDRGSPLPLKLVKTQALCQSTPNSLYTDSITVYVNLIDGRAPGDEVLLLLNGIANNVFYKSDAGYLYFSDVSFMGGGNNVLLQRRTAVANTFWALAQRCSYMFSSGEGYKVNGIGGSWIENCIAYKNVRDGFNYRDPYGYEKGVIEINCESSNNGGYPDTTSSVNGSSAHDGVPTIRINGKYYSNVGPNVIDVGPNGRFLVIGTTAFDSKGFVAPHMGANFYPDYGDYGVGGNGALIGSEMWVVNSTSQDSRISFATDTQSTVLIDTASRFKSGFKLNASIGGYATGTPKAKYLFPLVSTYTPTSSVTSATAPLAITGGNIAITSPLPGVNGGTGVSNSGKTITLAGNLNLFDANNITLRSGGSTNVTLPTTGTLYGSATGSVTSLQLATSLTNETGGGNAVFSASPTITGTLTTAAQVSSSGTPTIVVGGSGNAGTGATVSVAGNNQDGVITVNTGTGASTGILCTITLNGYSYTNACVPVLTHANLTAITGDVSITNRTTNAFAIYMNGGVTSSSTYQWTYHIGGY